MLLLTLRTPELYNELNGEIIPEKTMNVQMEHSLVSLKKWESKYHKPFLSKEPKTNEETLDYIKFMTITQNVPDEMYENMSVREFQAINDYMQDPMTATWFSNQDGGGRRLNGEQITAELIYYWMIAFNIPVEFQKWHINQLLTLIRICNLKNQPEKKMSRRDVISNNAALNAARRKMHNSKG